MTGNAARAPRLGPPTPAGPKATEPGYASVCEAFGGFRHLNGFPDRWGARFAAEPLQQSVRAGLSTARGPPSPGRLTADSRVKPSVMPGLHGPERAVACCLSASDPPRAPAPAPRPPVRPNISLGDTLAGLHAAFGAVMALLHRSRWAARARAVWGVARRARRIPAKGRVRRRGADKAPHSRRCTAAAPLRTVGPAPDPARGPPRPQRVPLPGPRAAAGRGARWWTPPYQRASSTCWRPAWQRRRWRGRTGRLAAAPFRVGGCGGSASWASEIGRHLLESMHRRSPIRPHTPKRTRTHTNRARAHTQMRAP
jgi:hypothetical protein